MIYAPHPKQASAHRAFWLEKKKRGLLLWGRQVGKTTWALNHAWWSAALNQGRYLIIFPTYRQAADAVWAQYLHYIPKEIIAQTNSTDLTITLKYITNPIHIKLPGGKEMFSEPHNKDLPPSTIELKGSDEAERLLGIKAHGLIFDEYATQNPEHWRSIFLPMLSTTDGWTAFVSSPRGFNHWYEMVVLAEGNPDKYWLSKATWRDNPAITREFVEAARADAEEAGELSAFLQEYELEFRSVEGSVYPEFNRDVNVVSPNEVPKEGTIVAGIDFGWTEDHPTAVVFMLIDKENNWWIFDEINASRVQMSDIAEMIKQRMIGKHLSWVVADSARPEYIELARKEGIPAIPVAKTKDSITTGIAIIGGKLKPKIQLLGSPKPNLFVASSCPHTLYEFEVYKYPSKQRDRSARETPLKENDHFMDSTRYIALQLKYGTQKKNEPIKAPVFGEYGMLK